MIIVPVPGPQPQLQENELRYPPNIFDLVILRETLMYLDREDKAVILRKIKQLLRRGRLAYWKNWKWCALPCFTH